jgi:CheY-like chemotaxis protein/two-component sensor histidine kinase
LLTAALGLQPLGERATSIAGGIGEAVEALSNQLDALLDVSKLDAGIVAVNVSVIDLNHLLERLASGMRDQANSAGIDIHVECPTGAMVSTDERLLESIVRNLMTNTISHNSDCSLRLSARPIDTGWSLTVADSGAGIPPQEQLHIFEEFYQINNPERDRSKGLGLGLSIVKRLADLLALDMRFESTPGIGTRFEFALAMGTGELTEKPVDSANAADLSKLRIIVLDDEHSVREAMSELLVALDCQVFLAGDIRAALDIARNGPIDLALVDYRLRGEDNGLNAVRQLRDIQPELAAIIVSGDTAPDRLQEVAAAELPLLSKPVSEVELREEIARVLAP